MLLQKNIQFVATLITRVNKTKLTFVISLGLEHTQEKHSSDKTHQFIIKGKYTMKLVSYIQSSTETSTNPNCLGLGFELTHSSDTYG